MRNLKRALSLALASVMLLGMMVVGTSAASYPDVDDNDNVEAIEVLNAVNVMIGRQGNFEPDEAVNRHEMAVIMAKLVLGVETADNYVGSHPFTDVVSWADKYVAACYENGLVAGTSATTFSGSKDLTAVEAAAMMLRALGYKDLNKGYQGDWRAPITAKANEIRLFSGVAANPNEKLNRNQVAQLALNTLKSPMVTLIDGTFTATGENGQLILTGGAREYKTIVSGDTYAKAISDVEGGSNAASSLSGFAVELGEHLYNGKLRLDNNDIDAFGRPARTWEYNGKTIGTYAKTELLDKEYVGKVTGKDLYDLLGSSTIKNYDLLVEIDGVEQNANAFRAQMDKNNKASVAYTGVTPVKAATGTGVVTEVYTDSTGDGTIYIAIINTYLAQAAKDYDAKKEELTVTVYGVNSGTGDYVKNKSQRSNVDLALEDFPNVKDMKKDDFLLVNVAEDEVVIVSSVEALEGVQVSSFKKNSNVTVNGQKYDFAETAYYDNAALSAYTGNSGAVNLKDTTYNIYLDEYDNLIGIKEVEAKKNYVFITGVDNDGSYIANKTGKARALFLDGTSDVIEFNAEKSARFNNATKKWDLPFVEAALVNTWCTYTKTSADVYTLTEVADAGYTGSELPANIPQPGVSGAANTTKLAQFYQFDGTRDKTIDKQNITLAGGGTSSFNVVYGNKDTVYLTAKLGTVVNNSEHYGIINGVENVTVGAEKANLKVWDTVEAGTQYKGAPTSIADGHANGVYTLYNNNGVVIAAVVVGEDSGAAKNLVYAHTGGLEQEGYGQTDSARAGSDEWDWSRKVIKDGEEVLLTERGDNSSFLEKMEKGYWYQVKLNADGDVIDAGKLDSSDPSTLTYIPMTSGKTRFVTDNTKIGTTVSASGVDTVLYSQRFTSTADGKSISTNGWTLYVTTQNQAGFLVHENAKIVLQQYDRNTQETYITEYVGADNLKSIVDEMNERNIVTFKYQVNAVLEHGVATSVVINSEISDWKPVIGGGDEGSLPAASWNGSAIEIPYYKTIPSIDAVRASVESVIGPVKTVSYTWAVTEDGAPYSVLLKEYIAVKVDGVPKIYTKVGATNGDITGLTDGVKYLKDVKYKATADYTVASKKITVGGTAVAGTDVELYTAYSVTLQNTVTASDGTNTVGTGEFVATGTEVTFTGNLTSGRRSFTVDGETYGSVTTSDVTAKATMKLTVTKDITVGEAQSYGVNILGVNYGEKADGDKITFTSSVPVANLVSKKGTTLAAVDSITAAGDTREYTVDQAGDAHTDGVITIVEAYKITAQTETKVKGFGTTWEAGEAISGTITAGTTFVEPGTKVYMISDDTTRIAILNPVAAADDKAGITVTQEGVDGDSKKVASFTMPKHTVAASAFCWDKYTVATQTDTHVALYTDAECTTAVTDGGLYDVGTTLYVKCDAGYATATKPAAGYTKLTDKTDAAGETGTFVMQPKAVANNAFTASNA